MVLSVADPNWSSIVNGNPDSGWVGIAQRVEDFVSAQVIVLLLELHRLRQHWPTLSLPIQLFVMLFWVLNCSPSFQQKTPNDKFGCMLFSSILRLSQGILAITVTLFLIVTTFQCN